MRIPKSMAPIDSRFAGIPCACKKMNEKEEGQGNGERDDHRGSNADYKSHQDKKNEGHPKQHVVFNRVDCQLNKVASVVIGEHFYVGGRTCSFR